MYQDSVKEMRIKKFWLYFELMELEERIINAIVHKGSPELIEESKKIWRQGHEYLKRKPDGKR